ncbi:MAG: VOC family protein [Thermomicrobiales bacterium]
MRVLRIVPNIAAGDAAARQTFYEDFLGLGVVMDHGWTATYASPEDASHQVSAIDRDASAPVDPAVSFGVDDVDAFHAAAVRHGVEIVYGPVDEPWGVRRFFVRAPGGAVVNIVGHR